MADAPPPRTRRTPNTRRFIVMFAGLIVVGLGLVYGLHWLANPWALALPGKPALIGVWQGEIAPGTSGSRRIVLRLDDDPPSATDRCGDCPDLSGIAKVCAAKAVETYELWGDTDTWDGSRFFLHSRSVAQGTGTTLRELTGSWDGDLVVMTSSSGDAGQQEVRFELRRAADGDLDGFTC
ncbi:MAG: hypothetical protein HOV79_19225 [Hamadaea sp.]|nr:hypothetical protein [Hamadaea sp.]